MKMSKTIFLGLLLMANSFLPAHADHNDLIFAASINDLVTKVNSDTVTLDNKIKAVAETDKQLFVALAGLVGDLQQEVNKQKIDIANLQRQVAAIRSKGKR